MLEVETNSEATRTAVVNGQGVDKDSNVFVFPAGLEQGRYWILDQLGGASTASNMAIAFRLEGPVDDTLVERSLYELVLRHEALRTTFRMIDGELSQVISEQPGFSFAVSDLRSLSNDGAREKAEALILEHGHVRIDLDKGPVLHVRLIHVSGTQHFLAFTVHHIACDGWSNGILIRDFTEIYEALARHRQPVLPDLPFQFADFTVWQREWLQSNAAEAAIAFWRENLRRDMPAVDLPTDRPRTATKSAPGNIQSRLLKPGLTAQLKEYCRQHDATMHQVLLAACEGFLSRYTDQAEFLLGSTIANRTQPGMENVVGRFANPQVIPADVRGDPSFHELVEKVTSWSARSYAHQDLPFSRLMEEFQMDQTGATSQFLQVYFVYQKAFMQPQQAGPLKIIPRPSVSGGVNFDFLVSVVERAEGPRLQVEYNTLLFEKERVRRFIESFEHVLVAVMDDDRLRVSEFPLIVPGELDQLHSAAQAAPLPGFVKPLDGESIPAYLDRRFRDRQGTAIVSGSARASWDDLGKRSLDLARGLLSLGAKPGQTIALRMEQTLDAASAMIAALRVGAAVLPIPPSTEPAEWTRISDQLHPPLSLAGDAFAAQFPGAVSFSAVAAKGAEARPSLPDLPSADAVAWAALGFDESTGYTSTGITHGDSLRAIVRAVEALDLGMEDVLAVWPAFTSANAWQDVMLGLVSGATLLDPLSGQSTKSSLSLDKTIEAEQVTAVMAGPEDLLNFFSGEQPGDSRRLHRGIRLIGRGPGLLPQAMARAAGTVRKATLLYGSPAAAGPFAAARLVQEGVSGDDRSRCLLTIFAGEPIDLVDSAGHPVPFDVPGEIVIHSVTGGSAHTGYLARYSPEHGFAIRGRMGRTVPMHGNRGYRLRLEDLESLLWRHPQVAAVEAVVLDDRDGAPGTPTLTAFVSALKGSPLSEQSLRDFLRSEAPPHLAEAEIVLADSIPRYADGSILIRQISRAPAADGSTQDLEAGPVPPSDDTERVLVRIWEETLGKRGIGVRDSFFSLGGYSLMIVRLFARINKHFGKSLPITTIFNAPTIEQLAEVLRGRAKYSALVPVQPKGSKPPFFLLLSYLIYDGLRSSLGDDQPIYGLRELPGEAKMTVEERATTYIRAIQSVAPHGPYHLGGWCAAGPLTVETARQLMAEGETVSSLILFDSWRPGYAEELAARQKGIAAASRDATLRRKLRYHRMQLASLSGSGRLRYLWRAGLGKVQSVRDHFYLHHWKFAESLFSTFGLPLPDFMHSVSLETLKAVQHFQGRAFPGHITLIRATDASYVPGCEPACGWDAIAQGGVEVTFAPGSHQSMFIEPNLIGLAGVIRELLAGQSVTPSVDPGKSSRTVSERSGPGAR